MKAFTNANPRDLAHARDPGAADARERHARPRSPAAAAICSGMMKERLVSPDVLVNLKSIKGLDQVAAEARRRRHRRPDHARRRWPPSADPAPAITVLAEAAESVATPQIRNVATLAGNVCQRPWCWYYRNGFTCFKNGGNTCYSVAGENQFHAIFGGGPSYIVHPSDTAPALVALDATFRIAGPAGERMVPAADFFALPTSERRARERARDGRSAGGVHLPRAAPGARSTYHKVLDREAWTHAVVSAAVVLEMDNEICRERAHRARRRGADSVAAARGRGAAGRPAHHAGAGREGRRARGEGARPLAKNAYKVPLTRGMVRRTLRISPAPVGPPECGLRTVECGVSD